MQDLLNELMTPERIQEIGRHLGIPEEQAKEGLAAVLPALTGAAQQKVRQEGGLASLAGAIERGDYGSLFDAPTAQPEKAVDEGNRMLGELFGSKDTSRAVAAKASAQTALGADMLKKLLPLAAGFLAQYMAKRGANQGDGGSSGGGGLTDVLGSVLDKDGDGSFLDDVLGGALGGLFGGR